MYSILKKLIEKKFYADAAEAAQKADVFYACNKLTDDQYAELTALIADMYPEEEIEPDQEG